MGPLCSHKSTNSSSASRAFQLCECFCVTRTRERLCAGENTAEDTTALPSCHSLHTNVQVVFISAQPLLNKPFPTVHWARSIPSCHCEERVTEQRCDTRQTWEGFWFSAQGWTHASRTDHSDLYILRPQQTLHALECRTKAWDFSGWWQRCESLENW